MIREQGQVRASAADRERKVGELRHAA